MTSNDIRASFLDFFNGKKHKLVTSAPIVIKNDPTLMFTNAGMNQFKDVFLGNTEAKFKRIADTQKCLRVSGKHNDLEEVGHDTYHHTMFEMLGNWSFGDYFKKEAIAWAWEFLTEILKIDKSRLYATIFKGDPADNLEMDTEALNIWKQYLDGDRIIACSKKDNFWEMGDQGPCGPCSEIHIDLRDEKEIGKVPGREMVNKDHPLVIEIWNLVFIQYNRKANGQLENLPEKHIDTGMGFERLCMVAQGKKSNYDTDVFQAIIQKIGNITGFKYGDNEKKDIAMRVIADHLRAVSFSIADGQLPSNNKAGYVIRRILRRAIRYAYSFLKQEEAFIYKLVEVLGKNMGEAFPEIITQKELIEKVIREEENTFLRTLANGIKMLDDYIAEVSEQGGQVLSGKEVFILYDTYGFPVDLTELILKEKGFTLDHKTFQEELAKQKNRSKADARVETDDWVDVNDEGGFLFVGYDTLVAEVEIVKYRKVITKGKEFYHIILNKTPFYAESGGQVGDTGYFEQNGQKIAVVNTIKENNLSIHITKELPARLDAMVKATVNAEKRINTECNHSATHLLHFALRKVLGNHVEQRGSLVHPDYLRFDFSHFQKMSDEDIRKVESLVNEMIRKNNTLDEKREVEFEEAKQMGAMALFGEKYDDKVRVIKFGDSIELCGGTHVEASGKIGYFKIIKESAVAAGIRRIEAITSENAEKYIENRLSQFKDLEQFLHNPKDIKQAVESLFEENNKLKKQLEEFGKQQLGDLKGNLIKKIQKHNDVSIITDVVEIDSVANIKDLAFQLKGEIKNLIMVLGAVVNNKANLTVMISDNLVKEKGLNASAIIKECASEIQGGGGGQPFYATAGGKNTSGVKNAVEKAYEIVKNAL